MERGKLTVEPVKVEDIDEWVDADLEDLDGTTKRESVPVFARLAKRPTLTNETGYSFVDGGPVSEDDVAGVVRNIPQGPVSGSHSAAEIPHGKHPTPVVPPDEDIINLPVEFDAEIGVKAFAHRFNTVFNHPTLRAGKIIHLVMPRSQFDRVCILAADCGGIITYDSE